MEGSTALKEGRQTQVSAGRIVMFTDHNLLVWPALVTGTIRELERQEKVGGTMPGLDEPTNIHLTAFRAIRQENPATLEIDVPQGAPDVPYSWWWPERV